MQVAAIVLCIEVGLRYGQIDSTARWVGAPLADAKAGSAPAASTLDLARLSESERLGYAAAEWTLARWVFDATCLRQALVRGWILRRREPQLHIGLVMDGDSLAHAWLDFDGLALGAVSDTLDFGRPSGPE